MQQRLDWILKFVFLSARFDNIFTKAQNIYIYLTLQGRGTSSLQLAATAKIGRAPLQKPCPYLKFGAHATHDVGVKFFKWEEFFPYLTRKEPLWNLVECVLFHTQCVILHTMSNFSPSV